MTDPLLARILAVGLLLFALAGLICVTVLGIQDRDTAALIGLVGVAVGGLVGRLTNRTGVDPAVDLAAAESRLDAIDEVNAAAAGLPTPEPARSRRR